MIMTGHERCHSTSLGALCTWTSHIPLTTQLYTELLEYSLMMKPARNSAWLAFLLSLCTHMCTRLRCSNWILEHCENIFVKSRNIPINEFNLSASFTAVQGCNRKLCEEKLYYGQQTYDPATTDIHYMILPSDSSWLYRKHACLQGVNTSKLPEYNVDNWLNPGSPDYKPTLAQAIFYYNRHTNKDDRFKICIQTDKMNVRTCIYTTVTLMSYCYISTGPLWIQSCIVIQLSSYISNYLLLCIYTILCQSNIWLSLVEGK